MDPGVQCFRQCVFNGLKRNDEITVSTRYCGLEERKKLIPFYLYFTLFLSHVAFIFASPKYSEEDVTHFYFHSTTVKPR